MQLNKTIYVRASQVAQVVMNPLATVGDSGSIPESGRSPGGGNDDPLQYSGLENSMSYVVHGVTKNQTRLSDFHNHNADGLMAQ